MAMGMPISSALDSLLSFAALRIAAAARRAGADEPVTFDRRAMDRSIGDVLKAVDPGFTEILDPFDSRRVMRYALMKGGEEVCAVDLLSPCADPAAVA